MRISAPIVPKKRLKRWVIFIVATLLLVVAMVYILAAREAYDLMSLTGTVHPELLPDRPYDEVSFPSRGRTYPVYAFWQTTKPDAPVIINVHGYKNTRYSTYIQNRANMLLDLGYNVLTPDLSDNGGKTVEDGRISMGYDESYDVLGGYDYLLSKGFKPQQIGLVAESMGAAASLRAMEIQTEIKVIWADSPYSDAPMVLREQAEVLGFPGIIADGGLIWAQILSNDNISAVSPITYGADLAAHKQSVYLVTCEKDATVNPHHAKDLYADYTAKGVDVQFWEIKCSDHASAILFDHDEYAKRLGAFLQRLPGSPTP